MKEMNIQFHKTRPQNPFDDGAKARLHRMGLLRIDGSVDEHIGRLEPRLFRLIV